MTEKIKTKKTFFGMTSEKRKKLGFYLIFIAFPVLHYLVFYVYINFNSFVLAFREYYVESARLTYKAAGFTNFASAFKILAENSRAMWNSFLMLAVQLFVTTPLALLFSYFIYKRRRGTEFFRVMLFLPSVLSAVVFGLLYQAISDKVVGEIQTKIFKAEEVTNFLTSPKTSLLAVIIFNILMGFGVSVLTYSGTMSGINVSLIESAELDGCSPFQEFIKIVIPLIWPTVITLMIVSFSRVFTDQWQVYTLLNTSATGTTTNLGYFLYRSTLESGGFIGNGTPNNIAYPTLSAMGLILTVIVLPLTLILRWALNKYGPKAD